MRQKIWKRHEKNRCNFHKDNSKPFENKHFERENSKRRHYMICICSNSGPKSIDFGRFSKRNWCIRRGTEKDTRTMKTILPHRYRRETHCGETFCVEFAFFEIAQHIWNNVDKNNKSVLIRREPYLKISWSEKWGHPGPRENPGHLFRSIYLRIFEKTTAKDIFDEKGIQTNWKNASTRNPVVSEKDRDPLLPDGILNSNTIINSSGTVIREG